MPTATLPIASASGLVFAFWFVLAIVAFIGFSTTFLAGWVLPRQISIPRPPAVVRTLAVIVGLGLFSSLFGWAYASSLAGFHAMDLQDGGVVLHYVLPRRQVRLPWHEIGELRREPSFRNQWRLVFHKTYGARIGSTNGSYRDVKQAWLETSRQLERIDQEGIRDGDAFVRNR